MRIAIAHPFDARLSWRWPINDVMRWTGRSLSTMKRWRADPSSIDPGLLKLCQLYAYGVVPLEHPAASKLWCGFHFDSRDGALVMPNNTAMTAQQLLAARTQWSIAEARTLRFDRMERELIALRAEVLRQLGEFELATKELTRHFPAAFDTAISRLLYLCAERDSTLQKL